MTPLNSSSAGDDLLTADLGKNDYDWLLTPPGTPLLDPLEPPPSAYGDEFLSHAVLPNLVRSLAAIKTSRLSSSKSDPVLRKEASNGALLSVRPDAAIRSVRNGLYRATSGGAGGQSFMAGNAISMTNRRTPLVPASRPTSRPTTPTKRPTSSSTAVSRPMTPTSRAKVASTPASRPTTPTSRSRSVPTPISRPSTPSCRPSIVSTSRAGDTNTVNSSTAARGSVPSRPTTPSRQPVTSQAQNQPVSVAAPRSSSVNKGRPAPPRSTPSSRGSSPVIKSNAWQQLSEIPGFSLEPPPNLRTTLPTQPSSNARGASVSGPRPGTPLMGTGTGMARADAPPERPPDAVTRRPASPSFARGRSSTVFSSTSDRQGSIAASTVRNGSNFDRSPSTVESDVNVGKAVERMVISRRPFPSSLSPEMALSASQIKHAVRPGMPTLGKDNASLGRNTPRKSAPEAPVRHLERQSSSNGLRQLVRNTPASSLYSIRPAAMRALSSSSPMATSSNGSPDHSCISAVREPEIIEEFISEAGSRASPASQSDSLSPLMKSSDANNWLSSPEYKDATPEAIQERTREPNLGRAQNAEKPEVSESATVCRHGSVAANCDLCSMKIRLQKLNEKCRASLRASLQVSEEAQKGNAGNNGSL